MTPHGEAHHRTHTQPSNNNFCCSLSDRTTTSEGHLQEIRRIREHSIPQCESRCASVVNSRQLKRDQIRDSAPRCEGVLPSQSRVLRCVGGVSWGANQRHDACCRQISGRTKMSAKISGPLSGEFPSAISLASHLLARQSTSSPREPAAIRDQRGAGFAASGRRRAQSMPSWPTSSLGSNNQMVSRHRFDGFATLVIRGRKVQAVLRSVCSLVLGLRRACNHLHADDLPSPIAHTFEQIEPSGLCHAFAWPHHLLSDRGGGSIPALRRHGKCRRLARSRCPKVDGGSPAIFARSFLRERHADHSSILVNSAGGHDRHSGCRGPFQSGGSRRLRTYRRRPGRCDLSRGRHHRITYRVDHLPRFEIARRSREPSSR